MNPDDARLLIVDDNPTNIQILASLLGHGGYSISFATDGFEALEHLRSEPCELVLLDIMMPGMSGLEVCSEMQQDPALARIPVIFVTALHDQETLLKAFQCGGVDYLTKPFIAQELVARVQIHLRLHYSENRLRSLLAMRELMMSSLSHDLRGPIGTLATMLELMHKQPMPPERSEKMLASLAVSARRTYELLEDLLTWSRAISEELPFHPQSLPLRPLVQECLEFHRAQATEKNIHLQLDLPADRHFFADANLVRTILINLLGNAIKFTPVGGQIRLGCEASPGQLSLLVRDTGMGVPANLMEQLERNHAIVSRPGTGGEKGTGMGLKICQEFAARHGGRLELRPVLQGSCFALVLPQPEDL